MNGLRKACDKTRATVRAGLKTRRHLPIVARAGFALQELGMKISLHFHKLVIMLGLRGTLVPHILACGRAVLYFHFVFRCFDRRAKKRNTEKVRSTFKMPHRILWSNR